MGDEREWHTTRVKSWVLERPDVLAKVRGQDSWRLVPLALQLAARAAREELPDVDFHLVDWDAAVQYLDQASSA